LLFNLPLLLFVGAQKVQERSSGDDGGDQEVFKKTLEERDAGCLRGEKAAWPKCRHQTGVLSDAKVSSSCAAMDVMNVFVPGLSLSIKLLPFIDALGAFGADGLSPYVDEAR